jgi:hypothetical protein
VGKKNFVFCKQSLFQIIKQQKYTNITRWFLQNFYEYCLQNKQKYEDPVCLPGEHMSDANMDSTSYSQINYDINRPIKRSSESDIWNEVDMDESDIRNEVQPQPFGIKVKKLSDCDSQYYVTQRPANYNFNSFYEVPNYPNSNLLHQNLIDPNLNSKIELEDRVAEVGENIRQDKNKFTGISGCCFHSGCCFK